MVVATLVAVLVAGSTGAVQVERADTDFMGSPRSARLLSGDEALGGPTRAALEVDGALLAQAGDLGAAGRLNDINSRIQMLELSRPGIGWSIAGIVVGSLLAVPGLIFTVVGIIGIAAAGAIADAAVAAATLTGGIVFLVVGGVLLVVGVLLIGLGASGISSAAGRNSEIDGQVDSLKQERRQLETQLGRPLSSMRDWAPSTAMTVAQF